MPLLRIRSLVGDPSAREVVWNTPSITIGSGSECGVVLRDPAVSRHHAIVEDTDNTGKRFRVVDRGSDNGVYVGTERIRAHDLAPGEFFRVGNHEIAVLPTPAGRPAAPPLQHAPSASSRSVYTLGDAAPDQVGPTHLGDVQRSSASVYTLGPDSSPTPAEPGYSLGPTPPSRAPTPADPGYSLGPAPADSGYALGHAPADSGYALGPSPADSGYAFGRFASSTDSGYALGPPPADSGYSLGSRATAPHESGYSLGRPPVDFRGPDTPRPASTSPGPFRSSTDSGIGVDPWAETSLRPQPPLPEAAPARTGATIATPEPAAAPPAPEPAAPVPQPTALEPEPTALEPEPTALEPEPAAHDPAPASPEPEPVAPAPEPVAPAPEPAAPTPEFVAPAPEPAASAAPGNGAWEWSDGPSPTREHSNRPRRRRGPTLWPGVMLLVLGAATIGYTLSQGFDPAELSQLFSSGGGQ